MIPINLHHVKKILFYFLDYVIHLKKIKVRKRLKKLNSRSNESVFCTGIDYANNFYRIISLNVNADIFKVMLSMFVPVCNYNSNCFKIINEHYLDHIKDKISLHEYEIFY